MPRTVGEMQRSRQIMDRSFTERCNILRATVTPSPGPGEPAIETFNPYLVGVACRYIPDRTVEMERGGRVVRIRAATVAVPHDTDVTGDDLISAVFDLEGNQRNTGNLSILGVNRYDGHVECIVEEVG